MFEKLYHVRKVIIMHGIIFTELKKYVDTKLGENVWDNILKEIGLKTKTHMPMYMPIRLYPDEEAVAIVTSVSKIMGRSVPAVLEDFGEFIVPTLLKMYQMLVEPEWRTLDVVENTEAAIHKVVRSNIQGAEPPRLICHRVSSTEIGITYNSARKMCGVAKGIIRGLANQYNERIAIAESSCMLEGKSACEISVRLTE
ncbi:MAG: heme NO-binding domain-containing protein [Actinobacteria bacterium]|nr:heme NO-binding domain-containing protein [Actinomycetota bacterium]